ncbi:MAG: DUF4747 family protein [Bacteroidota bacterium]|jgi:hypothetical protein|nr:DUF4747 family protein [Bacteroidota bacterium]
MTQHKRFSFYTLNIKRNKESKNTPDSYKELISVLHKTKRSINVRADQMVYLRKYHDYGEFINGVFSRFTNIDLESDWLNFETGDIATVDIPSNVYPNWKDLEFYFFPEEHKMAVHKRQEISLNAIIKFLRGALNYSFPDEIITVDVVQSENIFKKIYEAKQIKRLEVHVTYTNDDLLPQYSKFFDDEMKDSGVHELGLVAKPDHKKDININNKILGGAIGLAKANGFVKASIVNQDGSKEIIKTFKHPRTDTAEFTDAEPISIAQSIKNIFQRLFRLNDE